MPTNPSSTATKTAPKRKPPAKPKVSRAAAEKAVADMKAKPKKGTFRGIEITLPPELPAAFSFDIAEVQVDLADGAGLGGLHRLLTNLLGPEQWRKVRQKITDDGEGLDALNKIVTELFDTIVDPYGVATGK